MTDFGNRWCSSLQLSIPVPCNRTGRRRRRDSLVQTRPSDVQTLAWNSAISPSYLADEFLQSSDLETRRRLPSASGGFRGGPSRLRSPAPLGDGLTPSLTVLLICDNGTKLWTPSPFLSLQTRETQYSEYSK